MFDSSLSPSSILNILRVKWRENPQQESQTLSNIPDDEPHTKTHNLNQHKENSQPTTLGYLDSLEELDSPSSTVKTIKGILKSPKESLVLRSHAEFGTTSRNHTSQSTRNNQQFPACFKQNEQEIPLTHENLNEKKRKKVTFSAETKKPEIRRNRRYVRIKKNIVRNNSATDLFKVESSPGNNLAPIAEITANYSPRNMFKITKKTSDPGTSPRCAFNVNISHKQSNHPDDLYDDQKYTLNIPRFAKSLSSDTQSYSSLQTMLEESSVYPNANSSETPNYLSPIGSFSARNTTLRLRTPQNANLHDITSSGPFMTRDDQVLPRVRREENLDYYAELQKKAPLIVQNMPSPTESKTGSRPISQTGDRSETFIIRKRYFIKPLVTSQEKP